jgi:cytochrome c-type biogenesis protein CcmH/NrfF
MLIGMCLLTCVFLVVNRIIVAWLYTVMVPPSLDEVKLQTFLLFVGPVALIFVEWWIIDFIVERLSRLSRAADSSRRQTGR